MNKLFPIILTILFSCAGFAQTSNKMSFEQFESWMKTIKISDYSFMMAEADEDGIYSCGFANKKQDMFVVFLRPAADFNDVIKSVNKENVVYEFNKFKTYFIYDAAMENTSLYVEAKNINSMFVITFYSKKTKKEMEAAAVETGLYKK